MAELPKNSNNNNAHENIEWTDAIKENPLLFGAILLVFGIVVLLACLVIYLLGVNTGNNISGPPIPTTTLEFTTSTPEPSPFTSTATSIPNTPSIDMLATQGDSGILMTITGQNWTPGDTLVIKVEDPTVNQNLQPLFANVQVANNSTFIASFILPVNSGWSNLTNVLVTVESSTTGQKTSTQFSLDSTQPVATATPTFIATPVPNSTPTPTTEIISSEGDWLSEYYAHTNLVGSSCIVRHDTGIDFYWGTNPPYPALPSDGYAVRWTRTLNLDTSVYRFHLLAADGVRLWIDEQLIIDEWFTSPAREIFIDYPVTYRGTHNLRIEYTKFSNEGRIRFWWEKLPNIPPPDIFPPIDGWHSEYYPNATLAGSPSFVRKDSDINFNWGTSAPASGLPNNNYSMRWLRQVDFEPAYYRFYLTVDDGARLWIDDFLVIDEWRGGDEREISADLMMDGGFQELRIEFFKNTGNGVIRLRWEKVIPPTVTPTPSATPIDNFPDWQGEYWPNTGLSGDSILVRNDPQINFNWGTGSPDSNVPSDNFSARWSRSYQFENGIYRFTAQIKDGVRFYIDGNLVLDQWFNSSEVRNHVIDLNLNGRHWLVVEFYHSTGQAVAVFNWQQTLATPTSTPTVTFTPTPSPTFTPSPTITSTPIPTQTPTDFPTPPPVDTLTPTPTNTITPTTPIPTIQPTETLTATIEATAVITATP